MSKKPLFLIIIFPFLGLAAALILAAFADDDFRVFGGTFAHPAGSDVIGIFSNAPAQESLRVFVHYEVTWQATALEDEFVPEGRLRVHFVGPFDGEAKILIPVEAVVLSRDVRKEETFKNLHAFSTTLRLREGEGKTFQFRYRLPARRSPHLLHILPASGEIQYRIVMETPDYIEASPRDVAGKTARSKLLRMRLAPAHTPFEFAGAGFEGLSRLRLAFNRTVSGISGSDVLHYSVRDLNTANPEVTDRIFVEKAAVSGSSVLLHLKGLTFQPGETYEVTIRDIEDKNGMRLLFSPATLILSP